MQALGNILVTSTLCTPCLFVCLSTAYAFTIILSMGRQLPLELGCFLVNWLLLIISKTFDKYT
jgi:hypothetical protein